MKKRLERPLFRYFIALFLLLVPAYSAASAGGASVFRGRVSDVDGRAVEGARIFVYGAPEVRRSADFISAPTDKDGLFRMVLPPGKFWSIARLKKGEAYGPLMPGDKHSGEPVEIELASGGEVSMDFTVADLKEAQKKKTREREGAVKISGKIVDKNGAPVKGAYAVANRTEKVSGIPEYVSAWVDAEGQYTLYLPRGKFHIGSAVEFPPERTSFMNGQIDVDADRSDFDIVRDSPENR